MLALLPVGGATARTASPSVVAPTSTSVSVEVAMFDAGDVAKKVRCEVGPLRRAATHHAAPTARPPAAHGHGTRGAADRSAPAPAAAHAHASVPTAVAASHASHASHDAGCQPTPEQRAAADALVAEVRSVLTRRFDAPEKAVLAGYSGVRGPRNQVHYFNREEQADPAVLDSDRPEAIVYDGRRVIGALFIMPKVSDTGPQIGGCLTLWHRHRDDSGSLTPEMLHVWIVENPGGPFSSSPSG